MKNTIFAAVVLVATFFAVSPSALASGTAGRSKPKALKPGVRTPPPDRTSGITEANGVATDVSAALRARTNTSSPARIADL
jgi:hypothetical protein